MLSYFHAACESSGSDGEAGLPVQGLRDWIRGFSGVDESQSVSHLIDPDWPQALRRTFLKATRPRRSCSPRRNSLLGTRDLNGLKRSWCLTRWSGG